MKWTDSGQRRGAAPSHTAAALAVAALVAVGTFAATGSAGAAPARKAAPATGAAQTTAHATVPAVHTLTLITGDRIRATTSANGALQVTVPPGGSRPGVTFTRQTGP